MIPRYGGREKPETETDTLTRVFYTFHRFLINAVALARVCGRARDRGPRFNPSKAGVSCGDR